MQMNLQKVRTYSITRIMMFLHFQTYLFAANSKYTPSVSYQRLFLRRVLKLCEDNGSEISDELYEAYGDVFGKVENLEDKCFKTYVLVRPFIDYFVCLDCL